MLDIADGALGPGHQPCNAFIAFGATSGQEFDRHANADLVSPLVADPRQIVREDKGGPGTVDAMDRNDGLIGQRQPWVKITNRPGVPLDDLAEIDVRKDSSGQPQLSRPDALQVHDRHHAAHHDWKLDETRSSQLFGTQWSIGRSEIHGPALDLPDAHA